MAIRILSGENITGDITTSGKVNAGDRILTEATTSNALLQVKYNSSNYLEGYYDKLNVVGGDFLLQRSGDTKILLTTVGTTFTNLSNTSAASSTVDEVKIGSFGAGRPAIFLGTSNTTYTNSTWFIENIGASGKFRIGRNGLDILEIENNGASLIKGPSLTVIDDSDPSVAVSDTDTNYKGIMTWRNSGSENVLEFVTRYAGTYYTNNLVLDRGKVGIGTGSPGRKLTVTGDVSGDANNLLLSNENDTNGDSASIGFSMLSNNTYVKAGIFFQRITTQGRGDLIFANNNEVNGNNVGITNEIMSIRNTGAIEIKGTSTTLNGKAFITNTDALMTIGSTQSSGVPKDMAFFNGGERMRIQATTGNVGIGVTSPSGKLEVAGGTTLGFRLSNLGNQSAYDQVRMTYTGYNSGSPTVTFMPLTTPGSGNAYTTFLFQNTNGINASSNNNANVAIDGTLQVGRSKGLGETTLIMNNYDTSLAGLNQIQNSIRMSGRYWSGSASQLVETRINSVHQESDGNGGSALTFMTQTGGSAVVEQMRIDKVGNVGIGTTSPVYKLDVKGSDTNNAIIARFYSNVGARGDFIIRNGSGTSPTTYIGTGGGSEELSIGSNNTNSIYIDSQQKVGIGTTSPGEKLEVNGNIKAGDTTGKFFTNVYTVTTASFADTFSSSGAGLWEYTIRINPNPAGSGSYVDFYYGKVGVGTGWNGSNVTDYIWYQEDQTAPRSLYPSGGGNKTISWVMVSGGSEVTNVSSGATVTIRVKGFGGNSYNQNISIYLRRLA